MKVLITGGSGMVGKNLKDYLEAHTNHKILSPSSTELNLTQYLMVDDYLNQNKPDIIIHCAGIVGGIQANIDRPFSFLSLNTQIGLNLVEASIKNRIEKLINLGSSCMYPKDRMGELSENDILTGPLEPTNEGYALAKITVSKLCEFAYREFGFNYKTIIPCNLYGKYDKFDPKNSHMIPAVIRKINLAKKKDSSVQIWGDGKARREFMYAEDLADFISLSIENYHLLESFTNVGLGRDYTILEYYQSIAKVIGFDGKFDFDLSKPIGMNRKLCSIVKQNKLQWKPKHSLMEGIEKTNNFFLENYAL